MADWKVGQKVWVAERRREAYEGTIKAIGRIWATLDDRRGTRFNLVTGRLDRAGPLPGHAYASREEHERIVALDAAWTEFWRDVNREGRTPPWLTLDDITKAREILRLSHAR